MGMSSLPPQVSDGIMSAMMHSHHQQQHAAASTHRRPTVKMEPHEDQSRR